jgi:catecholate siderophore receptor
MQLFLNRNHAFTSALAIGAALAGNAAFAAPTAEAQLAAWRLGATSLDAIEVSAAPLPQYQSKRSRTATRTDTALRDVPQSITVITRDTLRDQNMLSVADVVRYVPGVGIAQGEGNRDTPVFRGNSSTSDLFVDGIRDDVQYFRDFYNIEQVEVLRGPNAMIFGRGGSGGVLNRVTKVADGEHHRELSLSLGSWSRARGTADVGQTFSDQGSFRVAAMYEDSGSYRDGMNVKRHGINPSLSWQPGDSTTLTMGYEHFHDERVADRGIPSFQGRPLGSDSSQFFGDPARSPTWVDVDAIQATLDHEFTSGLSLRNRLRVADYDKFYQNVYPGAVSPDGSLVTITAYNNATERRNLFNQTDLMWITQTGGLSHQFLAGLELGRQNTENFRQTGYFSSHGAGATSTQVSVAAPRATEPIDFRQSASDADNQGVATIAALYLQDQIEFSPNWLAVLGVRFDRFEMNFDNRRSQTHIRTRDDLWSPRAGLIYKPVETVSVYANYSLAYVPRAGEQLTSLTPSNQSLDPEKFVNYELGAKWEISSRLSATAALFRLDRNRVSAPDPTDPSRSLLVDGQYTEGLELELAGRLSDDWSVLAGYAWQRGEITADLSATVLDGAQLAQLPRHSGSIWNRYDVNERWSLALGLVYRGSIFAALDNTVELPAFTRFDAAVYFAASDRLQLQLNIENLTDTTYYASAHNNNNITPGSPLAAFVSAHWMF